MFNLSLTACSFHFRKTYSKSNEHVYDLNAPLRIKNFVNNNEYEFDDLSGLFFLFFEEYTSMIKNDSTQQSFNCEYDPENVIETPTFNMFYAKIYSGTYGSSSDIFDGETQKVKYKKTASDIDMRPFFS